MNQSLVDRVVRATLYEGYLLYPYRPSVKNRQRWTFGGLCPQAWSAAHGDFDPSRSQTQCLIVGGPAAVTVSVRFLHLVTRQDANRPDAWQEAVERSVTLPPIEVGRSVDWPFEFAATFEKDGERIREQRALAGNVEVSAELVAERVWRLTVRVINRTPVEDAANVNRDEANLLSLASAHVVLTVEGGGFVSLTDPPDALADAARTCKNVGTWPVPVGEPGDADVMLSSPIILPDYPQVAPESPGDLFDATEIDEILTLRILTLTDDEKRAVAALDDRARALLERTESLSQDDLLRLHGAIRRTATAGFRVGDKVRLRPRRRADILDIALDGQLATVVAVEQDFEDRVHLAVTVDADPGQDLGEKGQPGHRFFFYPDEVERMGS